MNDEHCVVHINRQNICAQSIVLQVSKDVHVRMQLQWPRKCAHGHQTASTWTVTRVNEDGSEVKGYKQVSPSSPFWVVTLESGVEVLQSEDEEAVELLILLLKTAEEALVTALPILSEQEQRLFAEAKTIRVVLDQSPHHVSNESSPPGERGSSPPSGLSSPNGSAPRAPPASPAEKENAAE
jgi:hypothetical protein